jgi:prefoldin beta subunit
MTPESQTTTDNLVRSLNLIKTGMSHLWMHSHRFVELQSLHDNLRRLTAQKSENESVIKEFEALEDDAVVWKMTGPLMVKHDKSDASENVSKRLEFIKSELQKLEESIKGKELDFEKKREELVKIQSRQSPATVVA